HTHTVGEAIAQPQDPKRSRGLVSVLDVAESKPVVKVVEAELVSAPGRTCRRSRPERQVWVSGKAPIGGLERRCQRQKSRCHLGRHRTGQQPEHNAQDLNELLPGSSVHWSSEQTTMAAAAPSCRALAPSAARPGRRRTRTRRTDRPPEYSGPSARTSPPSATRRARRRESAAPRRARAGNPSPGSS